jgi:hypothetical protein
MSSETSTDFTIRPEEIARLVAHIKRRRAISYIRSVIALAALSLGAIPVPCMPLIALFISGVIFMAETHLRHSYSTQLENLNKGFKDEALLTEMINRGSSYVLYLRDFDSETDTTDVLPVDVMWGRSHIPREYSERHILEPINKYLPVFAFLNYRSVMWNTIGYRVNAVGADWVSLFERYAASAALIIFDIERISEGLLKELDWAQEHCDTVNIVIIATKELHAQLRESHKHLISSASWRAGVSLPEESLQYLDTINSPINKHASRTKAF